MAWWEVSLSALVFLGLHVGISGSPVRQKMVERLAEKGYQIVFSVLSVLALIWLVAAWRNAPELNLWSVPGLSWLPVLLMPRTWLSISVTAYRSGQQRFRFPIGNLMKQAATAL